MIIHMQDEEHHEDVHTAMTHMGISVTVLNCKICIGRDSLGRREEEAAALHTSHRVKQHIHTQLLTTSSQGGCAHLMTFFFFFFIRM